MFMPLLAKAIEEFMSHLVFKRMSNETIRVYRSGLNMFDRFNSGKYNCPTYLEDVTTKDIEEYLEWLQVERQYAVASINRHLNTIRSFCHHAYKKGWVNQDASLGIDSLKREQKERTYLTERELQEFLGAMKHPLIQLAFRTMALTGLRVSECIHLTLDDVDLENDLILVKEGKGKKNRIIPIGKSLKPYLVDYVENWRVDTESDRFFASKRTGTISTVHINRILHETTQRLGWNKKITAHGARHSFASLLVSKNVNIVKISKLLGHADVQTTSIYTHSSQEELSEAVDLL
jgi:site-specific recombinase XerD